MRFLASVAALLLAAAPSLEGRAEVVGDGSVGPAGLVGDGTIGTTHVDYLITPEHGALRDTNLFFSFSDFSIESQKIGVFTGPAEVRNVLARVTGGDLSRIDGTLASTITGADVWLVNPNGVVFGAGSQLALRGAFHVSTGSYIRLADGSIFSATSPAGGGLTVAAPEAFGFLGGETGAIDLDVSGHVLQGRAFQRMSLVGGEISIHAGAEGESGFLWAQNGRIDLVGVASDGSAPVEIALYTGDTETLSVTGPWVGRAITVDRDAVISSSGVNPAGGLSTFQQGAGDIHVFGETLTVDDAEIRSPTGGAERGGDIDIDLRGDLVIRAREGNVAGLSAGTGIVQGPFQFFGAGDGGNISIRAENVSVLDGAQISTTSLFLGDAGNVDVQARGNVRIVGRGTDGAPAGIFSRTEVSGAGGRISIGAERLELDHGGVLVTETRGAGTGGSIVDVAKLSIRDDARIDSSTRSFSDPPGNGGTIDIRASKSVRIAGRSSDESFSGITAIAQGATDTLPASTARAGDIRISTPLLALADGGTISTQALGTGDGGSIDIGVTELHMNGGLISASAVEGQGGDVEIRARRAVRMIGGSEIAARASGAGDAGSIVLDAGRELELDASAITTESAQSNGGDVTIRARDLADLHRSEITTSVTGGAGGNIDIDPESVVLNESQIIARAGSGSGGNIRIVAGQFVSDASSTVDASSQTGIDGTVNIESPEVDQNSALEVLPSDYADAGTLLRAACAARTGAGSGTFVVRTGSRAAAAPDAPLDAGGANDDADDDTHCVDEPTPQP